MRTTLVALALAVLALAAGCRQRGDGPRTIRCEPGAVVEIGCAAGCGIGSCEGDATLRFCDGSLSADACESTTDTTMFRSVDDTSCGSLCPFARVTCPASGAITVVPGGFTRDSVCNWASNELGVLPPGGRGPEIVSCTPGAAVRVGCSDACGIGHCEPSTAQLRICDGRVTTADCQAGPSGNWVLSVTSSSSAGTNCDTRCPEAVVNCPDSGMLTISPSAIGGSANFWCEWETVEPPHRADGVVTCTPGVRYVAACAAGCNAGSCAGTGGIRVCDGGLTAEQCLASTTNLGNDYGSSTCDDGCPETVVTCPPSGALTVISRASWSTPDGTEGFACNWDVRAAGLGE